MRRILVAAVGNVLRGDDGFGPAVAARLGPLPRGVELLETGIGGVALLQELMTGYDGLVLLDAVDQGAAPGTVLAIEPEVEAGPHVPDVHLANPRRVLSTAKALGVLPERVLIVGCQAGDADELSERLSEPVERALGPAVATVERTVRAWLAEPAPASAAGA